MKAQHGYTRHTVYCCELRTVGSSSGYTITAQAYQLIAMQVAGLPKEQGVPIPCNMSNTLSSPSNKYEPRVVRIVGLGLFATAMHFFRQYLFI